MKLKREIVEAVLKDLGDRSGFDGWFDSLDYDVQCDIIVELESTVGAILEREGL